MNILGKRYLKTSNKLNIKRETNKLIIENNSPKKEKVIFTRIIKTKKRIRISSKANIESEQTCTIKVLNKKMKVIASVDMNTDTFLNDVPDQLIIGLSILPNSKVEINNFEVGFDPED